jgi:FMN-dependent NADH-azoreductase
MAKLLHIIATPRGKESRTLKISKVLIDNFKNNYPDTEVEELDLFHQSLPVLGVKQVEGKYVLLSGKDLPGEYEAAWQDIVRYIEQFLSTDIYLVSVPMWNFSIPYMLKHYIDVIVQPKYLFRYTNKGPEGLVKNKKMVIVTSRGGDYSSGDAVKYDFEESYLRTIFGFVGITDITFINAQPMDALGQEVQEEKIKQVQAIAREIVKHL